MEEMILVGYQWGSFQPDGQSARIPFQSVFMIHPFAEVPPGSDFHSDGLKAEKFKLASPDVAVDSGASMFDVCEVYFSSKGAVTKIVPTGKSVASVAGVASPAVAVSVGEEAD